MTVTPPTRLTVLAGLLGEALGGPAAPPICIDEALMALADRHQVAPLLHGLAAAGGFVVTPRASARLIRSYDESAVRRAQVLARLEKIGACFARSRIAWMVLKGTTQAEQLYDDPAWRFSSDIDLLVAPGDFRRALDALAALGFIASNPPLPRGLRGVVAASVRDVTLIAGDDHSCAVELHQRLFFAGPSGLAFSPAPGAIPAPAPDAALAFYLIAHGARSFWVRLKWLADLVPLFAKLAPGEAARLPQLARQAGAERSVIASLLLLRTLFVFAVPAALKDWLDAQENSPAVQHRLRRYLAMLDCNNDQKDTPLASALVMLEADWLLFDRLGARLDLFRLAPVSSAMRRLAAMLAPADRALTLPR